MRHGIDATFQVLAQTPGATADELLIRALDSNNRSIQEGAIQALLSRQSSRGPAEFVRRWRELSSRWRSLIARRPARCSVAVREAVISDDPLQCANGCAAGRTLCDYELVPTLVSAIEGETSANRPLMLETLLGLVESLYDELASRRDYRIRRDPHQVRQHLTSTLELSVTRFAQHQTVEIAEAFLIIVNRDYCGLKRILAAPNDSAHAILVERLRLSPRPGVMRLALSFLDDPQPPRGPLNAVMQRRDIPFVRHLLKKVGGELDAVVQANLKRVARIAWLHDTREYFSAFSDREHAAIVRLAVTINADRETTLEVLKRMLTRGKTSGRIAASQALMQFRGPDANELVFEGLEDPDPAVRATLLSQLRERGIHGAIDRLIEELDNPNDLIRSAAQQGLSDFNFARYMTAFEKLDEDVQISTGKMVRKIDPGTIHGLEQELISEVRSRRLRAISMSVAMGCVPDVQPALLGMSRDSDPFVRLSVINALANCNSQESRATILAAQDDEHATVRNAAAAALIALETLADANSTDSTPSQGTGVHVDGDRVMSAAQELESIA